MKIDISSKEKDFTTFYLARFLNKDLNSFYKKSMENLEIKKEDLEKIVLKEKEYEDFIAGENIYSLKENIKNLSKKFSPISKENQSILNSSISKNTTILKIFLDKLFTQNDAIDSIQISLIPTFLAPREIFLSFPGSVFKKDSKKIYLIVHTKDNLKEEKLLEIYLKVFFHEFSHVFLNTHKKFLDILENFLKEKFKEIDIREYQKRVGELLASSLFYFKDFGFAYKVFNFKENQKEKQISLENNKYRKITFQFLEDLENSKLENKLEFFLPKYLKDLEKEGLFTNF